MSEVLWNNFGNFGQRKRNILISWSSCLCIYLNKQHNFLVKGLPQISTTHQKFEHWCVLFPCSHGQGHAPYRKKNCAKWTMKRNIIEQIKTNLTQPDIEKMLLVQRNCQPLPQMSKIKYDVKEIWQGNNIIIIQLEMRIRVTKLFWLLYEQTSWIHIPLLPLLENKSCFGGKETFKRKPLTFMLQQLLVLNLSNQMLKLIKK